MVRLLRSGPLLASGLLLPLALSGCGSSASGDTQFRVVVRSSGVTCSGDPVCPPVSTADERAYARMHCPDPSLPPMKTDRPAVLCGGDEEPHRKFLLGPSRITGGIDDVSVSPAGAGAGPTVDLSFTPTAQRAFSRFTGELAGSNAAFALIVDGEVVSTATVAGPIDGDVQMSGDYSEQEAQDLADRISGD